MDADIRVTGGDDIAELGDLWEWLRGERALVGQVRVRRQQPGAHDLGGALDAIEVALGSGGAAAVLAGSLSTWITSRRSRVVVKVTTESGTVEVDARNVAPGDILPLLQQVMRDNG